MRAISLPSLSSENLLRAFWLFVIFLLFILALDSFVNKPGVDSTVFLYVADGILKGELPYLHRWDHKGPFIYLLNVVALLLNKTWGVWFVQGVFLLTTSVIAFLVLRRGFGVVPAFFALALFLVSYRWFSFPGNFTEAYALLFQFLALYLFLQCQGAPDHTSSRVRIALLPLGIGVLGAATLLLRPNLVALWIVLGLYWLIVRGNSVRGLAWAVLGGGSVLLIVGGLFLAIGVWDAFWEAVFLYNIAYIDASFMERLAVMRGYTAKMGALSLLVIAAWALATLFVASGRKLPGSTAGLLPIASLLFPVEIANLSLSGFVYEHYFLSILPATTLLLAFSAWLALERLPLHHLLTALLLLIGVVYYPLSTIQLDRLSDKYVARGIFAEDLESQLAERIKLMTGSQDYILAWGSGDSKRIQLLSGRDAPSRFFYHYPLLTPHPNRERMREEFFADLEEHAPVLIIHSSSSRVPPLQEEARTTWHPNKRYWHNPQDFEPFFSFVEANYVLVGEMMPHEMYVLRQEAAKRSVPDRGELVIDSEYEVYLNGRTLTYVKNGCRGNDAVARFILHVIPVDSSVIGGRAQDTLDFSFLDGKDWYVGDGCEVSRELPDYAIAAIRAGQYNADRTAHKWLEEYRWPQPE